MISTSLLRRSWLPAMVGCAVLAASAAAQNYYRQGQPSASTRPSGFVPPSQAGRATQARSRQAAPQQQRESPARVAQHTPAVGSGRRSEFMTRQPGEHPLMPAIRWARDGLRDVGRIKDYSCVMVKRELINGKLTGPEYIFVKIRHEPLSAYCYRSEERRVGKECRSRWSPYR